MLGSHLGEYLIIPTFHPFTQFWRDIQEQYQQEFKNQPEIQDVKPSSSKALKNKKTENIPRAAPRKSKAVSVKEMIAWRIY